MSTLMEDFEKLKDKWREEERRECRTRHRARPSLGQQVDAAVAAERARIRRELQADLTAVNWESDQATGKRFGLLMAILDRVAPGEG